MRAGWRRAMEGEGAFFTALTLPAVVAVLGLVGYPLALLVEASLRTGGGMDFLRGGGTLGLGNYAAVLADDGTWRAAAVSAQYVAFSVAPAFVAGLACALLLNRRFPGRRWLRPLMLLPWAVPGVVVSILFLWLGDSSYGLVNALLRRGGWPGDTAWFTDEDTALYAVVVPTIWKSTPFFTLMLLAALQAIPGELYEAARVDGARATQQFRHVTWPGLRGTAVLALLLDGLWVFREFDIIFASTGGGPGGATETLGVHAYLAAFSNHDLGQAAVLGLLMAAVAGTAAVLLRRPLRNGFF